MDVPVHGALQESSVHLQGCYYITTHHVFWGLLQLVQPCLLLTLYIYIYIYIFVRNKKKSSLSIRNFLNMCEETEGN